MRSDAPDQHRPLPLFVYGSLRRGQPAHRRYCRRAAAQAAGVWGRLYLLPTGYPALEIPPRAVLGTASADPQRDAARARNLELPPPVRRPRGDWQWICGDLLQLPDPKRSLPAIDRYEDFDPRRPGPYRRVLTLVYTATGAAAAWLYCAPRRPADARRLAASSQRPATGGFLAASRDGRLLSPQCGAQGARQASNTCINCGGPAPSPA